MAEKTVGSKKPTQKKNKTWGDEGFTGYIYYGCYKYKVVFTDQDKFDKFMDTSPLGRVYGAVCYDDQIVLVASNVTEQMKRLTLWHEIVHILLENNNVNDGRQDVQVKSEGFVDTLASRIYEVTIRNPEMMRWLMK